RTVLDEARALLAAADPLIEERGLTLIGVTLTNLHDDRPFQLELPFVPDESAPLDSALDEIKERFGATALTRAVLLGRDELTIPLPPDCPRGVNVGRWPRPTGSRLPLPAARRRRRAAGRRSVRAGAGSRSSSSSSRSTSSSARGPRSPRPACASRTARHSST